MLQNELCKTHLHFTKMKQHLRLKGCILGAFLLDTGGSKRQIGRCFRKHHNGYYQSR